ncbi:MAG: TonB-dependent receptor [Gammaproteobacteria bacterium]
MLKRFVGTAGLVAFSTSLSFGVDAKTAADTDLPAAGVVRTQASSAPSNAGATSARNESPEAEGDVKEVVVTAQKRTELLKDVPISVSVLGGKDLDRSSSSNLKDAVQAVPSVDFTQGGGYVAGGMISLRGVANSQYREGGGSTVAYYVDDTPYGLIRSAIVPLDSSLYDLERIEVLRGPQGTLYGSSALNGVIRVLTKDANADEFELKARTFFSGTQSGGDNYGADAALNVPLVKDKLGVRLSAGYHNDSGWIDSPVKKNVNSSSSTTYRLKINAQPTETFAINLSAWHLESDSDAPAISDSQKRITSLIDEPGKVVYDVYAVEMTKQFSTFSIRSATSYLDVKNGAILDGSAVLFPASLDTDLRSNVFTEELNVVSALDGPWRWSTGLFYRDAKDKTFQLLSFLDFPLTLVNNDYTDTSKSYAVFGELARRFSDKIELGVGLRYFHDKQSTRIDSPYIDLPQTSFFSQAHATTPRLVLTWFPTPTHTFYASYSEGFRSGLVQAPNVQAVFPNFTPAQPDKLHNYEVGAKGSLLNGMLAYEAATYFIQWKDVQQVLNVHLPTGLDTAAVVNGSSASGLGAEFSLTLRPTDALELGASLSWNGLKFDSDVIDGLGTLLFSKGARLQASPKYTAGASAGYSFPLGGNGLKGKVELSGNYKSKQDFYSFLAAPYHVYGDSRFNGGRLSFITEMRSRWSVSAFMDNLTNTYHSENPILQDNVPADVEWRGRSRPRTIGVQLEYRY